MRNKVVWLCVTSLMVLTLIFSSCGSSSEEEESAQTGGPQYGGSVSYLTEWGNSDPENWDPILAPTQVWKPLIFTNPVYEYLFLGDVETYGPRGNNKYSFKGLEYIPDDYLGGWLAESWEITTSPLGVTFHLREGVMWTGKTGVMESRELTADDVIFSLNRLVTKPGSESTYAYIDSYNAVDDYTVRINFNRYQADWTKSLIYQNLPVMAPEVAEAGAERWENVVGTGAFTLDEYVEGSYASYKKNPDWWGTTKIDGKEYETPFIEELVYPIIPDESTQLAALRTGTIDMWPRVPLVYESTLNTTSPDLIKNKFLANRASYLKVNSRFGEYVDDLRIRRALMMATDFNRISDIVCGEGVTLTFPVDPDSSFYTPFDELPESCQELWSNDPQKAKQLIADAGYPDGFKIELVVGTDTTDQDLGAMLVEQWSRAGVEVILDVQEPAAWSASIGSLDYELHTGLYGPTGYFGFGMGRSVSSSAYYSDDYYTEQYNLGISTVDLAERTRIFKDLAVYFIDQVVIIPFSNCYNISCYWPWIKNYYGEHSTGFYNQMPILTTLWVDQDLKAEMGY